MKKLIYIVLFLPITLFSQNQIDQNEKIFEELFRHISGYPYINLDISYLWEMEDGKNFLVQKLNNESSASSDKSLTFSELSDKSMALLYLGKSQDENFVEIISAYLESDEPLLYKTAIKSLVNFNSSETVRILEKYLLKLNADKDEKAIELISALSIKTSLTSVDVLNTYRDKCDPENKLLLKHVDNAIQDIKSFHKNPKKLISSKLYTFDEEKIYWCFGKLNLDKKRKYLPILRRYYRQEGNYYSGTSAILKLRMALGDSKFNKEEKAKIETYENVQKERRARTLELFSK